MWNLVQSSPSGNAAWPFSASFSQAVTKGNVLVVWGTTPSDSAGNVYTLITTRSDGYGNTISLYYAIVNRTTTITFTSVYIAMEFSGLEVNPLDVISNYLAAGLSSGTLIGGNVGGAQTYTGIPKWPTELVVNFMQDSNAGGSNVSDYNTPLGTTKICEITYTNAGYIVDRWVIFLSTINSDTVSQLDVNWSSALPAPTHILGIFASFIVSVKPTGPLQVIMGRLPELPLEKES